MSEDYYHHRNIAHRYAIQKVNDDDEMQMIDGNGLSDEEHTEIMRVFPHGFTSHSPKNSHMIAMGLGGRRDQIVALGGEHPDYRIRKLLEGETCVYDMSGNTVHMKLGKGVFVTAKVGVLQLEASEKSVDIKSKTDTTVKAEGKITTASKGETSMASDGDFNVASKGKLVATSAGEAAFGSKGGITYIGGDGNDGSYDWVVTVSGPSASVKAKL